MAGRLQTSGNLRIEPGVDVVVLFADPRRSSLQLIGLELVGARIKVSSAKLVTVNWPVG